MEAEKNEETQQFEEKIDWESLLSAANDPDLTELLQSPVDDAINILKCYNFFVIQKLTFTSLLTIF